jgi:outer membrane protein assembly factor BamC
MTPNHATSPVISPRGRVIPLLLVCTVGLSACSVLQEDKVDYRNARRIGTLEVPPDLTQLSAETRYASPTSVVTASGYQTAPNSASKITAASEVGDVRIERAGSQRWLVVKRPADKLWEPLRGFWQESGFVLTLDQANLGLMETDWAENRAKIPQDFIRNAIGKMFDSLYSTSERDKFRTRIERVGPNETEIYISHRGMQEVYSTEAKDQTVWQPRAADPELEAELLRRLMLKLGVSAEQAKAQMAGNAPPPKARLNNANGQNQVELDENFDRAWRRVGLALDRTGFTVEDRDRAQGVYFVRYVVPVAENKDTGFFANLFKSSPKDAKPVRYRVLVKATDKLSVLSVQTAEGQPDNSAVAQAVLKILADDLQ